MPEDQTNQYEAIVIGGSAGSFQPVIQILSKIPRSYPIPIYLALHRLKQVRHGFVEALSIKSLKKIIEPNDKHPIEPGGVYLAPANYHMSLESGGYISLSTEPVHHNSRPSIDHLFQSAAQYSGSRTVAILLSGANRDGASGIKAIKQKNGLTIIQSLEECTINTMPKAALSITQVDYTLEVAQIATLLLQLQPFRSA